MTFAGWTMLIVSWTLITALCVFCFYRVLFNNKE
jgi:hypothetical protein